MSHIFISHASEDLNYALKLAKKLQNEGFNIWIDAERLEPSDTWMERIFTAIFACDAFIIILSPAAEASKWVEREFHVADKRDKPLFPVLYKGGNWPLFFGIHVEEIYKDDNGDEKYPSKQFYEALARYSKRQERGQDVTQEILNFDDDTIRIAVDEILDELATRPIFQSKDKFNTGEFRGESGRFVQQENYTATIPAQVDEADNHPGETIIQQPVEQHPARPVMQESEDIKNTIGEKSDNSVMPETEFNTNNKVTGLRRPSFFKGASVALILIIAIFLILYLQTQSQLRRGDLAGTQQQARVNVIEETSTANSANSNATISGLLTELATQDTQLTQVASQLPTIEISITPTVTPRPTFTNGQLGMSFINDNSVQTPAQIDEATRLTTDDNEYLIANIWHSQETTDPAILYLQPNTLLDFDHIDDSQIQLSVNQNSDIFIISGQYSSIETQMNEYIFSLSDTELDTGSSIIDQGKCMSLYRFQRNNTTVIQVVCYTGRCSYRTDSTPEEAIDPGTVIELNTETNNVSALDLYNYDVAVGRYRDILWRSLKREECLEAYWPSVPTAVPILLPSNVTATPTPFDS